MMRTQERKRTPPQSGRVALEPCTFIMDYQPLVMHDFFAFSLLKMEIFLAPEVVAPDIYYIDKDLKG
jgi:hypothetical protein